ncbi:QUIRKY protein [Spatholobus suberectus]|nr:QUIRKY protein [Spatholobus suberectus]
MGEKVDFNLKVISPRTDAEGITDDGGINTATDLVKINLFLFVRARDMVGHCDPYVEVKVGRLKGTTLCFRSSSDEAFAEAWQLHLAAASIGVYNVANTLSRIYLMPRIFCLRVNLIQALGLMLEDRTESSQIFIHATLVNLTFTSKLVKNNDGNTKWNENLSIAVAEPFDQLLVLSMEQGTFACRHNLSVSLDGGYHVFDEDPRWNEQYSWDVYDTCTFITNCVFDNGQLHEGDEVAIGAINTRIGKVRITLSELETNRIYSNSCPLVELQPLRLRKMGGIPLAFKFCCPDMINLCKVYNTLPMLPRQHFANPLSPTQFHGLRKQTSMLVSSKTSKTEPPMTREVVEYMLDSREIMWSMPRGRADFERINTFVSGLVAWSAQFDEKCKWKSPVSTLTICLVLFIVIAYPYYLLPAIFSVLIPRVLLLHQNKPRKPSHVDLQLCHVHTASVDELKSIIRNRYHRLRVAAGKYVTLLVDFATRGERLQCLMIWQDPVATMLVMVLCLITGIVTLIVPFQSIVSVWLLYLLRHPILRSSVPPLKTG